MTVYFKFAKASPKGNGCGLALVQFPNGSCLAISVLPKWWSELGKSVVIDLDPLLLGRRSDLHVAIPEMATLVLRSIDPQHVQGCLNVLVGLRFADEKSDDPEESDGTPAPLFREIPLSEVSSTLVAQAEAFSPQEPGTGSAARAATLFWSGVEAIDASAFVHTPENESEESPALNAYRITGELPVLERVLRQLLVHETETALRRRTPDFQTFESELPFVRGSVTTSGLLKHYQRSCATITCEFAELNHDHAWQRLVRTAIRTVVARDIADSASNPIPGVDRRSRRCRRIDRILTDVSLVSPRQALQLRLESDALGKNRHALNAVKLARAVIARDTRAGYLGTSRRDSAVATGLRISSAKLFECALAGGADPLSGARIVDNSETLTLMPGGTGKRPDLLLLLPGSPHTVSGAISVLDAKSKHKRPTEPGQMSMSDQYQQFSYAAVSGKPTTFIFADAPQSTVYVSQGRPINLDGVLVAPTVCVARVPFPAMTDVSWVEQLRAPLAELISILVESDGRRKISTAEASETPNAVANRTPAVSVP